MRRFLSAFLVVALISGAVYFQFQPSNKTIHHQSKHPRLPASAKRSAISEGAHSHPKSRFRRGRTLVRHAGTQGSMQKHLLQCAG